ncbi:MAG: hypothetical protein U0K90_01755, partial [Bacteroidales bacterium]|nr:hypothetical protein [Bacteroidales bacterium]
HAWSGGGLTILSQYIAGIAPVEPQFKSFSVSPNLANLKWLESVVPARFGILNYVQRGLKTGLK